ncbi:MAG: HEPN domain-containing protein [Treponema sp.]|nr:HEPN domain-containing protein [Treponema sp.]
MNIDDVTEWIQIADDDLYSAQMLDKLVRKPYEIICYHCAQAVEKYLKGYLTYYDIIPQKTHNLLILLELCVEKDSFFENIKTGCGILNRYANEIRYPHRIEIEIEDVNYAIKVTEKIRDIEPLRKIKEIINEANINNNYIDEEHKE